ncbi:uncharacterized protein BYT42DRAFT_580948 [Radiomyces spectabilis]|uniref:uncharacterized protein n=1 Tax=Radiomyces spectabilis TaxID=64574 RepID=UPI00221E526D|nr:uncharacterized protein BYT42DRAFT_580948 [Radiomyces spectabilis]KAI8371641.1 hypothetical protein BYT42DRAFT_580948 [Radiomyces spectabilis]
MGQLIKLNIRPSKGASFQLEIDVDCNIRQLKEKIGEKLDNLSPDHMKLVYSGRILKDDDICDTYKLREGHTVHVVKSTPKSSASEPNGSPSTTEPTATSSSSSPANTSTPAVSSQPPLSTFNPASAFGQTNQGGMFGNMPPMAMDPDTMRQMMDSPFMQSLLSNTDFVQSIIMSDPQIKALVEQNPEIGHAIRDPAFLRQSMEMMRNPELMREMQRSNDRALSNIEALPGGFNHLRRIFNTVQDPLESSLGRSDPSTDEANERLARQLNVSSIPENQINTQALPNPWAATASAQNNNTPNQTTNAAPTAAPQNPFAGLFGAGNGSPGPMMFPFMGMPPASQQNQQNPSDTPQQQTTANAGGNNTALPFWADPNFIQASLRFQQAMMAGQQQQPQQPPAFPGMWGLGPLSGQGSAAPAANTEPPETRFQSQLAQLEEMGFSERQANVRALLATNGNVQAAIEYLLSQQ